MTAAHTTRPLVLLADALRRVTQPRNIRRVAFIALGTAILTFGIHNIHQVTGITEGGIIGGMLLINHWFGIPSSAATFVLDAVCYVLALRYLGWRFLVWSGVATSFTSLFYALWDVLPHLLPDLSAHPLVAALAGGCFVGIGCGLIVRQGGSSGGDDALALVVSRVTGLRLSKCYLATDLSVLALSLSYIPVLKIACSLVTVALSSFLIDWVVGFGRRSAEDGAPEPSGRTA